MIETENYWYDGQLRKYLAQFISIFYGLQVQTGVQACGTPTMVTVPTLIGSKDRVAQAILAGNTQNRTFSLPIMSANIIGMTIDHERRKAPDQTFGHRVMPAGGVFPDDLTSIIRVAPVAYSLQIELSIYASNTMQMHQILEQILTLFNPELQIPVSNGPLDWARLTNVFLTDITDEGNYPSGTDRRNVNWTLQFNMPIWLGLPVGVKDNIIRQIHIRLGTVTAEGFANADGGIVPLEEVIAEWDITTRKPEGPENRIAKPLPGFDTP